MFHTAPNPICKKVGAGWITVGADGYQKDELGKRPAYKWAIFSDKGDFVGHSEADGQIGGPVGAQHDNLAGLRSLLAFLGAASEAYLTEDSENADLFEAKVMEWAYMNSDEIVMLEVELDDSDV